MDIRLGLLWNTSRHVRWFLLYGSIFRNWELKVSRTSQCFPNLQDGTNRKSSPKIRQIIGISSTELIIPRPA